MLVTGYWFTVENRIFRLSAKYQLTATRNQRPARKTALLAYNILYYFGRKSNVVKKPITTLFHPVFFCPCFNGSNGSHLLLIQAGLVAQKENIITASTIVKIENLGPNINTPLAELRPTVSADGNLLFFIVENDPMNTKYNSISNSQDIWYAERDSFGHWREARHMGYPLNTYFYNAVFWISPDNNRILIRNAFVDGDYVGNGVSMSYRQKNGKWSKPNAEN